MQSRGARLSVFVVGSLLLATAVASQGSADEKAAGPRPKVIALDPNAEAYARVLEGPPSTVTMRSGYVVLAPGKSVGKHSTGGYEEAVVVLDGEGKMVIAGGDTLSMGKWTVVYCPPSTEHDVVNTGATSLRYVYLVAAAPGPK